MSGEPATPAAHHVPVCAADVAGNGGLGRLFFLPGSDARARVLAGHFEDRRDIPSPRQHNVYLGRIRRGDLGRLLLELGPGDVDPLRRLGVAAPERHPLVELLDGT